MPARNPISNEAFGDAVRDGYAAGLTLTQIAEMTGRTRSAVAGKANRLGISRSGPAGARRASTTPVSKIIRKLHADGLSTTEIAIATGLEVSNVRRRLKRQRLALNPSKPASRSKRPTPPDRTPTSPAGALQFRSGPVDLTPPDTSTWFADGKGCRFSCWPTTERDPMAKRCCGATATRGSYCDYHASVVYAPATKRAA